MYDATLGPNNRDLIWHARATIQITDLATGEMSPTMEHELFVSGVTLKPAANLLVTTWGTSATLWNPTSGQRIQDLDQKSSAFQPAFLPNSQVVAVATDNGINLWDISSNQELATLRAPARQMAFSADGTQLATIDQNGEVTLWTSPTQ